MRITPRTCSGAALLALALAACDAGLYEPEAPSVTAGTIGGVAFTVVGGTIFQPEPDGPVFADESGGQLVLDEGPAGLGMTNPDHIQLRTRFALADSGTIQIAAFGTSAAPLTSGHWVLLRRASGEIGYEFRLAGSLFADSTFNPPPTVPSAEHWVVTEFYAQDVPGYGAGESGAAMWELNNLTPAFAEDVLRCDPGPALDAQTLSGDAVAYALRSSWLLVVQAVDQIVGPCE